MQEKAQDSSYSGRDEDKAFMPETTYRGLFTERYVDNFIFQAKDAGHGPGGDAPVYEVLGRRHKFDPTDKEAIGMWDTTEGEKFFRVFFGIFRAFLAIIGSFTLHRGRHRRLEHHVRGGGGADARDRHQARGGRQAALHPRPVPGGDADPDRGGRRARLPDHAGRDRRLPGPARRIRGHARGLAGRDPHHGRAARRHRPRWPATSPRAGPRCSTPWWR